MNQIKLYDMDTNEPRGTLTCNGTRWREIGRAHV